MDVTIGVTVGAAEARIALLDAAAPHAVVDRSAIDLTGDPVATLVSTLVSTDRMLAQSGHRLLRVSLCSSDAVQANEVKQSLIGAELTNVSVVSRSEAMTAVIKDLVDNETTASLVTEGDTAALCIVDSDADTTALIAVESVVNGDRGAAYRRLLERLGEEPGGATSVILLDESVDGAVTAELRRASPVSLRLPDHPEYALALGAALAEFLLNPTNNSASVGNSLDSAETVMSPEVQQLAYSEVGDEEVYGLTSAAVPMQTPMRPLSAFDPDEFESDEAEPASGRPRALLLGSTVAAVVVVGFATLAVGVAISIRPAVSERAVRLTEDVVPGKYFPVAPGQGVVADGPAWTAIEELPPAGEEPDARTLRPKLISSFRDAGDTGAEVIKYYRDGTIGVQNAAVPLAAGGGVLAPGAGALQAPEFLTRLIPDFSRWSPCQVLAFVSNMRMMGEATVDAVGSLSEAGVTEGVTAAPSPSGGIADLSELGATVFTPAGKGALFETSAQTAEAVTDTSAIPQQIFDTDSDGKATAIVAEVLPQDTKLVDTGVLESLTPTVGAQETGSLPILGETFSPEVIKGLPGTTGTVPVVDPSVIAETVPGSDGLPTVPDVQLSPGADLGGNTLPLEIPSGLPLPKAPTGALPERPSLPTDILDLGPGGPLPEAPGKVDIPVEVEIPAPEFKPPVSIPAPEFKPPVSIPAPEFKPPVSIPAPEFKPPVSIPLPEFEPPVSIPEIVAPPVSIPEVVAPPVSIPELPKIIDIPMLPELPFQAPVSVPEPAAPPVFPSIQLPELPQLPFGGGLFGGG